MDNKSAVAVLFSSDSTPQYEKDIFNVIAAPKNGEYRFRYKKEYIDVNLLNQLTEKLQPGARVLIAFHTNSADENKHIDPFIVPIRWAEIDAIEEIDRIVIFKFFVKDYPTFSSEFEKACSSYDDNVAFAKRYFVDNNKNNVFVTESIPDIVSNTNRKKSDDQERAWIRIIEALSKYEKFFDKIFLKTDNQIPRKIQRIKMKERKGYSIKIVQFNSNEHSEKEASVEIQYDTTMLVSSHGDKDRIECRYDILEYIFIPKNKTAKMKTQVTFNVLSDDEEQKTKIRVPIIIKQSAFMPIISAILSLLGAVGVGLNGVLSLFMDKVPPNTGIPLFVVGSIFLAIAGFISKRE